MSHDLPYDLLRDIHEGLQEPFVPIDRQPDDVTDSPAEPAGDEAVVIADGQPAAATPTSATLPFSIQARTSGTTEAIFKAVRDGEIVSLVKHRIGNQRRRDEIALNWSEDERLRNGHPLDPAVIAREIERIEAEVLEVIDEPEPEPLPAAEPAEKERGPRQAELLVRLALERYRFGRTPDDEPFAVPVDGPNVAMMFKGSQDALRCNLARLYRKESGSTPNTTALAEALLVLQGEAMDADPEEVHLRTAKHGDNIIIDLGDSTGRVVVVRPGSWDIHDASPVLFRRTGLTLALPAPERGGDLNDLRRLLNVSETSWPLLRVWLVAALIPDIARAILLLTGLQGTGKSVAARLLAMLLDPSSAVLRSEPRDLEQWAVSAAASVVVAVDNISRISDWWSDALCRAVSGDGMVRRRLYSDSDLTVLQFRRVVLLTSIDPGALRGDLADRLMTVELERIPDDRRRLESEILDRFAVEHGHLFGAVLDLLAAVLKVLPTIKLDAMPRLADFARVVAAVDTVDGLRGRNGSALSLLMGQRGAIARDVVEGDPVGAALVRSIDGWKDSKFTGTAGELLAALTPKEGRTPKHWPENPRAMAACIKRLIPALRGVGIEVVHERRQYTVTKEGTAVESLQKEAYPTVPTVPTVQNSGDDTENADNSCTVGAPVDGCLSSDRTSESTSGAAGKPDSDGMYGMYGTSQQLLEGGPRDNDIPDGWSAAAWKAACGEGESPADDLTAAEQETYLDRAAVIEAGGVPRQEAERRALASVINGRSGVV